MKKETKRAMAMAFAMGAELIVTVLLGIGAGYYLGPYAGSAEWGAVAGSFVGFSVWIWRMMQIAPK